MNYQSFYARERSNVFRKKKRSKIITRRFANSDQFVLCKTHKSSEYYQEPRTVIERRSKKKAFSNSLFHSASVLCFRKGNLRSPFRLPVCKKKQNEKKCKTDERRRCIYTQLSEELLIEESIFHCLPVIKHVDSREIAPRLIISTNYAAIYAATKKPRNKSEQRVIRFSYSNNFSSVAVYIYIYIYIYIYVYTHTCVRNDSLKDFFLASR